MRSPITKNTMISMSIASLLSMGGGLWFTIEKVQGAFEQLNTNTKSIQVIVTSLELTRIDQQLNDFKRERRNLNRDLRADPINDLLLDQLDELNDAIENTLLIRACVIDSQKEVCK